ncbi:MAG: hypothetical protein JMDDDDMK_00913 [Acidobacteria bacterium]|nr:hypothetical protein [Acidobacteriota bacterium]
MNDQILVSELNGGANLTEESQSFVDRELIGFAILRNRLALDELHHEVRQPVFGLAAVNQPRDVRMFEPGQDAPFARETVADENGVHSAFDDLDGDLLLELLVGPGGFVNRAHPAATDQPGHAVSAQPPPDQFVVRFARERLGRAANRVVDERVGDFVIEQRLDLAPQFIVAAAALSQQRVALTGRAFDDGLKYFFDLSPAFGSHVGSWWLVVGGWWFAVTNHQPPTANLCYFASSRCSHACAIRISRPTVATEMSSAFAISSMLNPPK